MNTFSFFDSDGRKRIGELIGKGRALIKSVDGGHTLLSSFQSSKLSKLSKLPQLPKLSQPFKRIDQSVCRRIVSCYGLII